MGELKVIPPLPRRTRLKLWAAARANDAGYWLVCHGRSRIAIWMWKLLRMW